MPRERITFPATPDDARSFQLSIGWDKDHYMQLGLQVVNPDLHLVDILYGGEGGYLSTVGTSLLEQLRNAGWALMPDVNAAVGLGPVPTLDANSNTPEVVNQGWLTLGQMVLNALRNSRDVIERDGIWTDLSRHEANTLVRIARKARSAAYGRDE